MTEELNVFGEPLQPCSDDPVTGFYRDGSCSCGPSAARHLICVLATRDFLAHQRSLGNDLTRPGPDFPGLGPGDRWCVVAERWAQSYAAGLAPPVVLASTNLRALDVVPFEILAEFAADVPDDPRSLT